MATLPTVLRPPAPPPGPYPPRWTVAEFARLAELDLFHGQRAELRGGEILVLSPPGPLHRAVVDQAAEVLRQCGWAGVWVRMQLPVDFSPFTEPEPDVTVVRGSCRDYRTAHRSAVLLIIEVSDTILTCDRGRTARLYARLGVEDDWVTNVVDGQLEVMREPRPDSTQHSGHGY